MNKLEELQKLRKQVNLIINNIDSYPKNEINVLVSNHNLLMDIFLFTNGITRRNSKLNKCTFSI